MSEIGDIREALAGALQAVPGLHVVARLANVMPPAAVIELAKIDYHDASMGEPLYSFWVTLVVSTNDLEAAQTQLDAYTSRNGVRAAIEDAAVGDATVIQAGPYRRLEEGGMAFLAARLTVDVRP